MENGNGNVVCGINGRHAYKPIYDGSGHHDVHDNKAHDKLVTMNQKWRCLERGFGLTSLSSCLYYTGTNSCDPKSEIGETSYR